MHNRVHLVVRCGDSGPGYAIDRVRRRELEDHAGSLPMAQVDGGPVRSAGYRRHRRHDVANPNVDGPRRLLRSRAAHGVEVDPVLAQPSDERTRSDLGRLAVDAVVRQSGARRRPSGRQCGGNGVVEHRRVGRVSRTDGGRSDRRLPVDPDRNGTSGGLDRTVRVVGAIRERPDAGRRHDEGAARPGDRGLRCGRSRQDVADLAGARRSESDGDVAGDPSGSRRGGLERSRRHRGLSDRRERQRSEAQHE